MKRIIGLGLGVVVLAALAWIAWWFVAAEGQRNAFDLWLEKQRERGWQAEAATIEMSGFPGAFQLTVTDLLLADPRNDWSWSAPVLKAESSSAAPTRIAVDWPDTQTVGTTEDQITISAGKLATLLDLRPGPSMELREAATDAEGLVLKARSGWVGSAKSVNVQILERSEGTAPPNTYNLRGNAKGVKLPKEVLDDLDPTGLLKPQVETVTFVGHAAFDAPVDRRTVEESALAIRAATIREAGFAWGDMKLVVNGAFQVDDAGYPVGKMNIEAEQWEKIVKLATKSGVIDDGMAETITGAVKLLTALSGGGDTLSLPLRLKGGEVRLGPIAIADAPRLAPPR